MDINPWAVLAAAASSFVLGGIWYSPAVFQRAWQKAAGVDPSRMPTRHTAAVFGGAFALSVVAALVFALFLGPKPSLVLGLGAGASAGVCWVGASFGINYLFERRSMALFLINGGYHAIQFTLFGLILALWH